jgi:cytochrome c biogenesis protein
VKTGAIEVNHPLVHRGVAIYQTAYNQDEFGFWYSGFQLSKDPGEPLVWTGSILLIIGLCCAFSIRYRVLAVVSDAAGVSLQPLTGFGDERGQRLLEQWSLQGDSQKQSGQAGE